MPGIVARLRRGRGRAARPRRGRRRRRPGPVHRAAGRPGHRRRARRRARHPGVRRLLARRDRARAAAAGAVLVATDARRREVYWAAYDADGAPDRRPARRRARRAVRAAARRARGRRRGGSAEVTGLPVLGPAAPDARRRWSPWPPTALRAGAARPAEAALPAPPRRRRARRAQAGDGVTVTRRARPAAGSPTPRAAPSWSGCSSPATTRGPRSAFRDELRRRPPLRRRRATTTTLVGYAGLGRRGPTEAEVHTIGVDPAHQGRGIGRALLRACSRSPTPRTPPSSSRCAPTTSAAHALYASEGFAVVGLRKRYYEPSGADAHTHAEGTRPMSRSSWASRRPATRPASASSAATAATELLADEVASQVDEHARFGGVVPEVASRAHLEAMVPDVHRALATAGVTAPRRRRRRRHRGPGPGRRAARRRRRGQGLRARPGTCRSTA